jgi:putative nucleotidyltransferase with HDIG domain
MMPDLFQRARRRPDGVLRDVVLGFGAPLEGLAASVDLSGGPAGGLALLRSADRPEDPADLFLLSLVARALTVAIEANQQRRAAERNSLEIASGILDALEGRGTVPMGHSLRVAHLSARIAKEVGLSSRLVQVVEMAARLHDVGEAAVPDTLLQRPGPLSQAERDIVRSHAAIGARILSSFGEAASFVKHHHERPDGLGYPDGLRAAEIPVGAGIIGVAEAYDAMTHSRPYRRSRSRDDALDEIARLKGIQFHAEAAEALLRLPAEAV